MRARTFSRGGRGGGRPVLCHGRSGVGDETLSTAFSTWHFAMTAHIPHAPRPSLLPSAPRPPSMPYRFLRRSRTPVCRATAALASSIHACVYPRRCFSQSLLSRRTRNPSSLPSFVGAHACAAGAYLANRSTFTLRTWLTGRRDRSRPHGRAPHPPRHLPWVVRLR